MKKLIFILSLNLSLICAEADPADTRPKIITREEARATHRDLKECKEGCLRCLKASWRLTQRGAINAKNWATEQWKKRRDNLRKD